MIVAKKFKFKGSLWKPLGENWLDMAIDFRENFGEIMAYLKEVRSAEAKIKIRILKEEE